MRNAVKYRNTAKPEYIEKGGEYYRVVDLGGMKMMVRVRGEKEVLRDRKLWKKSKSVK